MWEFKVSQWEKSFKVRMYLLRVQSFTYRVEPAKALKILSLNSLVKASRTSLECSKAARIRKSLSAVAWSQCVSSKMLQLGTQARKILLSVSLQRGA